MLGERCPNQGVHVHGTRSGTVRNVPARPRKGFQLQVTWLVCSGSAFLGPSLKGPGGCSRWSVPTQGSGISEAMGLHRVFSVIPFPDVYS